VDTWPHHRERPLQPRRKSGSGSVEIVSLTERFAMFGSIPRSVVAAATVSVRASRFSGRRIRRSLGRLREIRQLLGKIPRFSAAGAEHLEIPQRFGACRPGTRRAVSIGIVTVIRTKTASVVLVASILVLTGGPLLGSGLRHLACAAQRHECAKVPILTQCCCGDHGNFSSPPATSPDRVDAAAADAVGLVAVVYLSIVTPRYLPPADTSPPLSHPPDLPVLFGDLRL
jgi:hypothetical protein